jgi:hypothetical protein
MNNTQDKITVAMDIATEVDNITGSDLIDWVFHNTPLSQEAAYNLNDKLKKVINESSGRFEDVTWLRACFRYRDAISCYNDVVRIAYDKIAAVDGDDKAKQLLKGLL